MALADREVIMEFVAAENPVAAIALDDQFEAKVEQSRQRPTLYKLGRVNGTREIVVRPNYVMIYAVAKDENKVVVLRVLHTARQWPQ